MNLLEERMIASTATKTVKTIVAERKFERFIENRCRPRGNLATTTDYDIGAALLAI